MPEWLSYIPTPRVPYTKTTAYQRSGETTYQSDVRCPECNLNWWLFPPVHIHGLPMVRCTECKRVYDEATGSEVNVG